MPTVRDTFCSHCGAAFEAPRGYPRTCAGCGVTIWDNPIPVSVVLVPVVHEARVGLLVVRRGIAPGLGKLAVVGGFLEAHETWQQGGAREVREETGVVVDAAALEPFWFTSTEPSPNRVLLFSVAPPVAASELGAFVPNHETLARGVVFGPAGLDDVFAFSLHMRAAQRFFASRGTTGAHDFLEL
jgi:ADP-ribose pyrophosphatase YjhB (NUDIX family)